MLNLEFTAEDAGILEISTFMEVDLRDSGVDTMNLPMELRETSGLVRGGLDVPRDVAGQLICAHRVFQRRAGRFSAGGAVDADAFTGAVGGEDVAGGFTAAALRWTAMVRQVGRRVHRPSPPGTPHRMRNAGRQGERGQRWWGWAVPSTITEHSSGPPPVRTRRRTRRRAQAQQSPVGSATRRSRRTQTLSPRTSRSSSAHTKRAMPMKPLTLKNARLRRERSCGRTMECS